MIKLEELEAGDGYMTDEHCYIVLETNNVEVKVFNLDTYEIEDTWGVNSVTPCALKIQLVPCP